MFFFNFAQNKFLWPGFGENSRVLEWIIRRVEDESVARQTPIGYVPTSGSLRLDGLKEEVDIKALFDLPKDFWVKEVSVTSHMSHGVTVTTDRDTRSLACVSKHD